MCNNMIGANPNPTFGQTYGGALGVESYGYMVDGKILYNTKISLIFCMKNKLSC